MTKGQADRLQRLQNRAARVITKSDYSIRSVEVLRQLQWDNLELRRFKHMAIQMYKIFNHKAPKYLHNYEKVCDSTHYNLRGHDIYLVLPKARTEYKRNSFLFKEVKIWNSLPEGARNSKSIKEFHLVGIH